MGMCSSKEKKKKHLAQKDGSNGGSIYKESPVRNGVGAKANSAKDAKYAYPITSIELPFDFDPSRYVSVVERSDNDFSPTFNFSYIVETLPPPPEFKHRGLYIYEYHCRCLQFAFNEIVNLKRRQQTKLSLGYLSIGTQLFQSPEVNVYVELRQVQRFRLQPHLAARMNKISTFTRAMVAANPPSETAEQGVRRWPLSMTISGNPSPQLTIAELNVVRLAQNCHSLELINGELFDPTRIEMDALREYRDDVSQTLCGRTVERPKRQATTMVGRLGKKALPVVDSRRSSMADVINMALEKQTDGYIVELRPFMVLDPDEIYKVNCRLLQEAVDNVVQSDVRSQRAINTIAITVNFKPAVLELTEHTHVKWLIEAQFNVDRNDDGIFDIRPHLDVRVNNMPAVADVLYAHKTVREVKLQVKVVPPSATMRQANHTQQNNQPGLATNLYVASLQRISDYDSVIHSQILKNPDLYIEKYKFQFKYPSTDRTDRLV